MISTVIFDFGGVISSPIFVGIGSFEEAEGFPKGSLLQLLFGETHYIGVEGRAVAEAAQADPDAAEASGEVTDSPDWHLLEKGQIDIETYFNRMAEKAPARAASHACCSASVRATRSNVLVAVVTSAV